MLQQQPRQNQHLHLQSIIYNLKLGININHHHGGDMNSYHLIDADAIYVSLPSNPPNWSGMRTLVDNNTIFDAYRICNLDGRDFTWENGNVFQRIDLFFVSTSFQPKLQPAPSPKPNTFLSITKQCP